MDRYRLWIWIIIVLMIATSVRAQDRQKITLDECVKIALKNNTDIVSAKSNYLMNKEGLRSAWGSFLPRITANAQYRRRNEELIMFRYQDLVSSKDSYYYDVSVSQPIFTGFRNYANLQKSQLETDMYEYYLVNTEQLTQLAVKSRYYEVLKNEQLLDVAQETLNGSEEELLRIETMQRVGSVSMAEVYQLKVRVGQNRLALIEAQNALITSQTDLNHTLGIDVNTSLELEEQELEFQSIEVDFDQLLQQALENRVDYLAVRNKYERAGYDVMAQRSGYYPQVSLDANYNWFDVNLPGSQRDLDEFDSYSVSVNLSLNIFDRFQTSSSVGMAKASLMAVEAELEQAKRQVTLDVKQAILNIQMSVENINVTNENLIAAQEDYRLAKERYTIGAGTLLEQISAEISLSGAKANRIKALYDYKYSLAALELAVGKLSVIDD
ncbi:TolC family protein [candidate division KSB1 bacterium]|nr:TolC family protein [candidate division KSB1 bacterium]